MLSNQKCFLCINLILSLNFSCIAFAAESISEAIFKGDKLQKCIGSSSKTIENKADSDSAHAVSFQESPIDILKIISQFLKHKEILSWRITSTTFKNIIDDHYWGYQTITINKYPFSLTKRKDIISISTSRLLQTQHLKYLNKSNLYCSSQNVCSWINSYLRNITDSLYFKVLSRRLYSPCLEKFTYFETAHNDSGIMESISFMSNLRSLTLEGNSDVKELPRVLIGLPSLTSLSIKKNTISNAYIRELISLPNLTFLDVSDNNINKEVPLLFKNLTSLLSLNISRNHISNEHIGGTIRHPNLTFLDVSDNNINEALPLLFTSVTSLSSLNISRNHVSNGNMQDITKLINLTFLDISGNNISHNEGFSLLFKSLPSLILKNIPGSHISDEELEAFKDEVPF